MHIKTESDTDAAASAANRKLNEVLNNAATSASPILLLLSGGSSLNLLEGIDEEILTPNITIAVLDERYSYDPSENNFAQITKTRFYEMAKSRRSKFIDTRVQSGETQEALAERFNGTLTDWVQNNPERIIIATVGIGPDGHTSGIMPYPEDPNMFKQMFNDGNGKNFVTSYDATGKNKYAARVTTNMNFLRKIDTAIIYAVGEEKRDAIMRLKSDSGSLAETPARIWKEIRGNVYLFTDLAI